MARAKESRDREYYLKTIRTLEKENKALKKQLKRLERREHSYNEKELDQIIQEEIIEKVLQEEKKEKCLECHRGTLDILTIVGRVFKQCTICGWRSRAKIADK